MFVLHDGQANLETTAFIYFLVSSIGVGASKFLAVQRIFPKFSQTCPKNCHATFADYFFGVTSKNWSSRVFLQMLSVIFQSQNNLGHHSCPDFQGFFLDFQQIRTFGGALVLPAPLPPTPLVSSADCQDALLTYWVPPFHLLRVIPHQVIQWTKPYLFRI